jgi:hypothetical protein
VFSAPARQEPLVFQEQHLTVLDGDTFNRDGKGMREMIRRGNIHLAAPRVVDSDGDEPLATLAVTPSDRGRKRWRHSRLTTPTSAPQTGSSKPLQDAGREFRLCGLHRRQAHPSHRWIGGVQPVRPPASRLPASRRRGRKHPSRGRRPRHQGTRRPAPRRPGPAVRTTGRLLRDSRRLPRRPAGTSRARPEAHTAPARRPSLVLHRSSRGDPAAASSDRRSHAEVPAPRATACFPVTPGGCMVATTSSATVPCSASSATRCQPPAYCPASRQADDARPAAVG